MIIEPHLIAEGHSSIDCNSALENYRDDLPPFDKSLNCRAEIDRNGSTMYVHIWIKGEFKLDCSRCLNPFPTTISSDFRIIIKEGSKKNGAVLDDDAVDFYYDKNSDRIDISSAIYDEILVTLPLMPLCNTQCPGISVNDNDIIVDFGLKKNEKKQIDPRWDALRKLKDK